MAKATLGGKTVAMSAPIRWALREGTSPVVEYFDLAAADALQLLGSSAAVTLHMEVPGGVIEVKNLYALYEAPIDDPYAAKTLKRVAVADRRWFWPYSHVIRRYNVRKRTGTKRSTSIDGVPENDPLMDKVYFHEWSLRGVDPASGSASRRWRPTEALEDVLVDVFKPDLASTAVYQIDLPAGAKDVPIEDLLIDDPGNEALDRILRYIPEARVWIDYDGTTVIDSRTTGREVKMVQALGPEIGHAGHIVQVNNALLRPRKIHVYFTREIEVRFDFTEPQSSSGTVALSASARECDNVLPIPDYQLDVDGPQAEGTWITFAQAFNAWGAITPEFGSLDFDFLCKAFVPFMDMWGILQNLANYNTDYDWGSRISAVQQHWRQTYRINPRWVDRMLAIRDYRVATIDRALGKRAPAVVYSDWTSLGTQRLWLHNVTQQAACQYARQYEVFPADGKLASTTRPAPAKVSIVDEDQGIIRADYLVDTIRMTDMVLPGLMEEPTIPTAEIDRAGRNYRPITFDSVIQGTEADRIPRMKTGFKCAFILTAIPGAPNNITQLQKVTVEPTSEYGACRGPEWHVRVGANVETARFKWLDAYAATIEKAFGVGADLAASNAGDALAGLDALCVNLDGNGIGAASLWSISQAVAQRIWASLADHYSGSASGYLNAALHPAGWLAEVIHEISTQGEGVSRIAMPETLPKLNLFGYMDPNTRAVVMRQVGAKQ